MNPDQIRSARDHKAILTNLIKVNNDIGKLTEEIILILIKHEWKHESLSKFADDNICLYVSKLEQIKEENAETQARIDEFNMQLCG